jgi:hypothetical protein
MVAWTWLPYTVRNYVQAAYMMVTQKALYNQGLSGLVIDRTPSAPALGRLGFSQALGALPAARGDQTLAALLARIDIYLVWYLVLVVLGASAFARLSARKASVVVMVIWVVLTFVGLLPVMVGLSQGLGIF